MKYYSELLDKYFDTEKDCTEAEESEAKKKDALKQNKEELTKLYNQFRDAYRKYQKKEEEMSLAEDEYDRKVEEIEAKYDISEEDEEVLEYIFEEDDPDIADETIAERCKQFVNHEAMDIIGNMMDIFSSFR